MDPIQAVLVGGPAELSDDRVREVAGLAEEIKLPRCGGYEHFRYSGESRDLHGSSLAVFEWSYRTKIAE
ncbi:DUF5988 family protein [Actinokineospora sp.]|uniref:DUF5988 family protein n=1 Tax=Actinokineospora sp. TaxID=1872133 RepID=UPI003D6AEE19